MFVCLFDVGVALLVKGLEEPFSVKSQAEGLTLLTVRATQDVGRKLPR